MTPEWVGWLSTLFLAVCPLPLAIQVRRDQHARGTPWGLLIPWGLGLALGLVYLAPRLVWPPVISYTINLASVIYITKKKVEDDDLY